MTAEELDDERLRLELRRASRQVFRLDLHLQCHSIPLNKVLSVMRDARKTHEYLIMQYDGLCSAID